MSADAQKRAPSGLPLRPAGRVRRRPMSRDKADALLLMLACVLVLAPHALALPLWMSAMCATLLAWRAWITFRGNRMPPRWLLLPLALLAMGGVWLTFRTFLGREAGVAMLALLLAFKLLEMRARRDLFVIVFLCFFLLLTRFFESQTILSALMAVAAVIALLTAQLSFQYTGAQPPLRQRLALGIKILALAAPLTVALFLLFPRIDGPLWGLPGDATAARTGLSDSMSPGSISSLSLSTEVAFRVRFEGAAPPRTTWYWRGPVMDVFDGTTWTPRNAGSPPGALNSFDGRGTPVRYQVTMEANQRRSLFALDLPGEAPQLAGAPVRLTGDRQLLTRLPLARRVRYEAVSFPAYAWQADELPQTLRPWTRLPANSNPASREYAAGLRAGSASDAELVERVLAMFRQKRFGYTLSPPLLGRDGIDEFLFNTRLGFCEHYAGAFVFLMRAMNIPARVVTGYQGGERNDVDGYVTVRQSDAHAWAEVWLPGRGWVRVDPTAAIAPERIERNMSGLLAPSLFDGLVGGGAGGAWQNGLRGLRQNWEALNNAWNQQVLDYGVERQRGLFESFGLGAATPARLTALMAAVAMLVMAIVAIPLLRNRQRVDPARRLYDTLCRQLARRGLARQPHEGPRGYRLRLEALARTPTATAGAGARVSPRQLEAALAFLDLFEQLRYGPPQNHAPQMNAGARPIPGQLKQLLAYFR